MRAFLKRHDGPTNGPTDRWTHKPSHRDATTHLENGLPLADAYLLTVFLSCETKAILELFHKMKQKYKQSGPDVAFSETNCNRLNP